MHGMLPNWLLAAGESADLDVFWLIGVGIFIVLSGLLKNYQDKRQREKAGPVPPTAPRSTQAQPPPSQSYQVPQRPRTTAETETTPYSPPLYRRPELPPMARPTSTAPVPARKPAATSRVPVAEIRPMQPGPGKPNSPPIAVPAAAPSAVQAQLKQMLRDPAGLQAALVLSEILAPPLALRGD